MAHPIGEPSVQLPDGSWDGMTPEGLQRAIGQSYMNAGIVPGNRSTTKVTGTTGWSYKIPACAVFMWKSLSARRGLIAPIEADTIPVSAPSGGATRTDTIYVDLGGVVRVAEGASSAPGGTVVLDRMVIPAGATNTQGATSNWDPVYAIPTGASLGRLAYWDGTGTTQWTETNPTTRFSARFTLPTDRIVRLEQIATLTTPDNAQNLPHYAAFTYKIDGSAWVKRAYFQADPTRQTRTVSMSLELPAGPHTVEVQTHIRSFNGSATGIDKIYVTESWDSALEFSLWDAGVAV